MNITKTSLSVSLLIVGLGFAVNGYSQTFLTNGLVAYYPFTGNANDAVGTNNGTVYGATLTTDRFGIPNSAYSFNGTSRIVTINPLPAMQSASASCWITVPAFTHSYVWMDGDTTSGYDFCVPLDKDFICFATKDNMHVCGNRPALTNTWFQVVAVADNENTNVLKMWLNGQLIATSPSLGNANVGYHSQLHIGCRGVLNDYFFNGAIDDLRFYNRALSASEVQQLYAIESAPPPCLPHPATATAVLDHGFVVDATINDGGCGYTNTPSVVIQGGGGTGATATAVVSNGVVVGITITDAGIGYTSTPTLYIYSPFGVQTGLIKAVKPTFSDLLITTNYQLQVSTDLITWTNNGSPFTPTNRVMDYHQYFDVDNWNSLYFRLQTSP